VSTGLRGINIPPGDLLQADLVTWEARYTDGSVLREREGAVYAQIERNRLASFCLVAPGEVIAEIWPRAGCNGTRLVYRRRSSVSVKHGRSVVFFLGWAGGPYFVIRPDSGTYTEYDTLMSDVARNDPDAMPPSPLPEEGEYFTLDDLLTNK